MKSIVQVNPTISAGFDFVAVDAEQWADALLHAGFQPDSRERTLGILPSVGSIDALATHGQGFRESTEPSLHCAVAKELLQCPPRQHRYPPWQLQRHRTAARRR